MAKVAYYGDHSVTFDVDGETRHTWEDWHLVPVSGSIPIPAIPQPKTNFKDIPGSDGQLDYTEVLAGLKFQMRQGSWDFYIVWNGQPWASRVSDMLRFLQGKRCKIILDDDPDYYYTGRIAIQEMKPAEQFSTITFDYVVDPYRYPILTMAEYDWPWDNLVIDGSDESLYRGNNKVPFGRILYGIFDVVKQKQRTLINETGGPTEVSITVSSVMSVVYDGTTYQLSSGTNQQVFTIPEGSSVVEFFGNGRVTIDYGLGKIL